MSDPLMSRFFRGLSRIKPVPFRILPKWDLFVLQGWIKCLGEEVKWLTLKAALLVTISTVGRISEL